MKSGFLDLLPYLLLILILIFRLQQILLTRSAMTDFCPMLFQALLSRQLKPVMIDGLQSRFVDVILNALNINYVLYILQQINFHDSNSLITLREATSEHSTRFNKR